MTKRFSDVFGIRHGELVSSGAFDPFIAIDAPFYVDPFLLRTSAVPEMKGAEETFRKHFEIVITLLKSSQKRHDAVHRKAPSSLSSRR